MSKNSFSICDFRKINVSKLEYSSPKTIQGGNQSSYIYYRESHNKLTSLFIRIPKLRTSSGICRKSSHYYIDLELDLNNEHSDFFDFLIKIDKNNRLITFQNSIEWFGDQIPQDTIEDYYIPSVKLNGGGKNSTFHMRIPVKGNTLIPQIYNNNTVVDHSYVSPHDYVDCIISLAEIRYSSEKFYPIWNLIQLRINKQITNPYPIDNILIEDEEDKLQRDNKIKDSERVNEIKKLEKKNKQEHERLEQERLEQERLEKERLEQERLEKERLEKERLEKERLEKERLEKERLEQERLEQERLEQERLKKERLEQERLKKERLEQERLKKEIEETQRFERFKKNSYSKTNITNSDDIMVETLSESVFTDINSLIDDKDINNTFDFEAINRKKKLEKLEKERIEREKLNKILEKEQLEKDKLKQRLELERHQKEKLMLKKQDHEGIFREKMERERIRKQLEEERLEKEIILQKIEEERLETERLQKLIEEEEQILEQERLEEEARLLEEEKLKELERQKEEEERIKEEQRIKKEKAKLKKLEKLRRIQQEMEELENDINTADEKVVNKFYEVDPDVKDELGLNDFEELSFD